MPLGLTHSLLVTELASFPTEADLLASMLPDNALAFALDTQAYWFRRSGAWHKGANASALTDPYTPPSGAFTVNGKLKATGDIVAEGGFAMHLGEWMKNNVLASQTDVPLSLNESSGRLYIPMFRPGSVIGIALYSNEPRQAGTCTAELTINDVEQACQAQLDGANPSKKITSKNKGTIPFVAGDLLGIILTTNANWLPLTADVMVSLLVEQ